LSTGQINFKDKNTLPGKTGGSILMRGSDTERRESFRLRPKLDTFVALRPEFSTLGKLMDINKSGLCFQYLTKEEPVDTPSALNIDMFDGSTAIICPISPAGWSMMKNPRRK